MSWSKFLHFQHLGNIEPVCLSENLIKAFCFFVDLAYPRHGCLYLLAVQQSIPLHCKASRLGSRVQVTGFTLRFPAEHEAGQRSGEDGQVKGAYLQFDFWSKSKGSASGSPSMEQADIDSVMR